jgi:hypothetical protein
MQFEEVRVCVDDTTISSGDTWKIIEPVWWSANIYGGFEQYEFSLLKFTHSQRLLFALNWYCSEVCNGGHRQFFSNPTGIVWQDALTALQELHAPELVAVLQEAIQLLGGSPSFDQGERIAQLRTFAPKFDDLDDRFYEARSVLDERSLFFIRSRPSDFYFTGLIRRAVFPPA